MKIRNTPGEVQGEVRFDKSATMRTDSMFASLKIQRKLENQSAMTSTAQQQTTVAGSQQKPSHILDVKPTEKARTSRFLGFMPQIAANDKTLQNLQVWWQKVTLTGKINSQNVATTLISDMELTKQHFDNLRERLISSLVQETLRKREQDLCARAQVTIDILIRNLFERTADVGFLATDDDLRNFLRSAQTDEEHTSAVRERLRAYTQKYSVYDDIVVLDAEGRVQIRLDQSGDLSPVSSDPLIRETLSTTEPYIETFRHSDLQPHKRHSLIYSAKITETNEPRSPLLGILCLCFRFDDEMAGIFDNLQQSEQLIALLDNRRQVIATSNPATLPYGASVPASQTSELEVVRHAGTSYARRTAKTKGYQGFSGLPWQSLVMLTTARAFATQTDDKQSLELSHASSLFSKELGAIRKAAETVTDDLILVVLNGQIVAAKKDAKDFMPVLNEIRSIGHKTKNVFDESISSLYNTVLSSLLNDLQFQAFLAVDIMDRNLYERANDVRWWALTSKFREILAKRERDETDNETLSSVLGYINNLYTVYTNLFLYDLEGQIIAVSNPAEAALIGTHLPMDGVYSDALGVRDHQQYRVSKFNATNLYGDRHTYVYATGILAPGTESVVGGIGIVFDSEQEFAAMLHDAAPLGPDGQPRKGAIGMFVDRKKRIISSTDPALPPGTPIELDDHLFSLANGERTALLTQFNGRKYAVGAAMSKGYREYKTTGDYQNDVLSLMLLPV